ncbi:NlpC/P60 family putative phage cell wall peptidase [Rhizobium sp. PP-CC-3A-592]|nr:NlpC/P60 family putative phage cell wall peptidase [Rhizobium sp. PP-CC-3A-592]
MTDDRCLHDESMRLQVLATARDWLGTPYRHQASLKGVGCDCLGLVRGIWRDIHGAEPETPPPYRPDWAERSGEDRLWDAATRAMGPPIDLCAMLPGDLLLFRWRLGMPAKHAGIFSASEDPGTARFIHAYEQASVVESALVPSWRRRIAGVFRFPEKV